MRAEPPLAKARTCSRVAMVVSPGKVVSSAPCAQPRLTASCSGLAGQQAVEEAGGKAIAAADAVVNIQFAGRGDDRSCPSIQATAPQLWWLVEWTSRRVVATILTLGIFLHNFVDHAKEDARVEFGFRRNLRAGDAQAQLQIFLVADQHIHILHDAADDRLGAVPARPRYSTAWRGSSGQRR